jgi:DNA mismatch endonuclease (patch repair protein)
MGSSNGSWASTEHARMTMRANRSRDTKPELAVRSELHRRGRRFRVAYRPLSDDRRRTVDIAFTRLKVAVHIDGCFWHGCDKHFVSPKTNPDYWQDKIARNQARDLDTDRKLKDAGWAVLRFWEHEDPLQIADSIEAALRHRSDHDLECSQH